MGGPFKIEYKPENIIVQGTAGVVDIPARKNIAVVLVIICIAAVIILVLRKKKPSAR